MYKSTASKCDSVVSHLHCSLVAHFLPPMLLCFHHAGCMQELAQPFWHMHRSEKAGKFIPGGRGESIWLMAGSGQQPAWAPTPSILTPLQGIFFWHGWSAEVGIWRAGGVVRMGTRWQRFTLCHLPACLAPHISAEKPMLAIQPYKVEFDFYKNKSLLIVLPN